jgi:hypothetical protein
MSRASKSDHINVSQVNVPSIGTFIGTGCGKLIFSLPANAKGSLVVRYGATGGSNCCPQYLALRALDAHSRLLRRSLGIAAVGTGLRPLWIDLTNVRTIQLSIEGDASVTLAITGLGILPRRVAPYVTANHMITIDSQTEIGTVPFVTRCNAQIGNQDAFVNGARLLAGVYLSTYGCGVANMAFCCRHPHGHILATFAVPDNERADRQASVTVVVKDRLGRQLQRKSYSVTGASPPLEIDVPIDDASIASFNFGGGNGALYNIRLIGSATIEGHIYAPSEPPTAVRGGVAINPVDFSTQCNAGVSTTDRRMAGDKSLESWALVGEGCGTATLSLSNKMYPKHDLYAEMGLSLASSPDSVASVRFNLLTSSGRIVRSKQVQLRLGNTVRRVHLALQGGSAVQIAWINGTGLPDVIVFAITAT